MNNMQHLLEWTKLSPAEKIKKYQGYIKVWMDIKERQPEFSPKCNSKIRDYNNRIEQLKKMS